MILDTLKLSSSYKKHKHRIWIYLESIGDDLNTLVLLLNNQNKSKNLPILIPISSIDETNF